LIIAVLVVGSYLVSHPDKAAAPAPNTTQPSHDRELQHPESSTISSENVHPADDKLDGILIGHPAINFNLTVYDLPTARFRGTHEYIIRLVCN
jgi:hypothetical protein